MKKVLVAALCLGILMGALVGCTPAETPPAEQPPAAATAETEQPAAPQEEPPAQETEAEEEAEPEPTLEPSTLPEDASPTTGLKGTTTTYKPIIVQIENEPPARPQKGIQWADVVYETMIEGIDTRFTCVFNDVLYTPGTPEELDVGPVRSSRYYHQWIQGEWDALYVHQGGAETPGLESYIWGPSSEHIKLRINGAGKGAVNPNYIYRRKNTGKALEHTAYTELRRDLEVYDYEPAMRRPFQYYPLTDYAEKPQIENIQLAYWSKLGWIEYQYDAKADKLVRYMRSFSKSGGSNLKEFIAEETGEALTVQNLIVQYATTLDFPGEQGRKQINVFGEGPAEFIIHGRHIKGSWAREDDANAPAIYYDEDGEEIVFAPGNTWIAVHPNDKSVAVNYQDGTQYITNAD